MTMHRLLGAAFLLVLAAPVAASGQSLSLSLLPGAVGFTLSTGSDSNPGTVPVVVNSTWTLLTAGQTVAIYGYFTTAATALAHTSGSNTYDIPSSRVEASVNGGANAPFNQTVVFGAANAGRQLATQTITPLTTSSGRIDTVALNVNLSGYVIPADVYSGTLRVRAQVIP